jgi:S1-C subfamily serine protease
MCFTYDISTSGTQGFVESRYLDPLNKEILRIIKERGMKLSVLTDLGKSLPITGRNLIDEKSRFSSGTGYFINTKGTLVTNAHVINDAKIISVSFDGYTYEAKLLAQDPLNDIAILDIELESIPLYLSDEPPVVGEDILVLGFPLPEIQGEDLKATFGNINSLSGLLGDVRLLQFDASIQGGNSGSPILNKYGQVIGTVVSKLSDTFTLTTRGELPQNINYGVKNDYLLPIAKKYNIETVNVKEKLLSKSELVASKRTSIVKILVER